MIYYLPFGGDGRSVHLRELYRVLKSFLRHLCNYLRVPVCAGSHERSQIICIFSSPTQMWEVYLKPINGSAAA